MHIAYLLFLHLHSRQHEMLKDKRGELTLGGNGCGMSPRKPKDGNCPLHSEQSVSPSIAPIILPFKQHAQQRKKQLSHSVNQRKTPTLLYCTLWDDSVVPLQANRLNVYMMTLQQQEVEMWSQSAVSFSLLSFLSIHWKSQQRQWPHQHRGHKKSATLRVAVSVNRTETHAIRGRHKKPWRAGLPTEWRRHLLGTWTALSPGFNKTNFFILQKPLGL